MFHPVCLSYRLRRILRQGYSSHGWPIKEPRLGNVGAGMFELDKIRIFDDMALTLSELSVYK